MDRLRRMIILMQIIKGAFLCEQLSKSLIQEGTHVPEYSYDRFAEAEITGFGYNRKGVGEGEFTVTVSDVTIHFVNASGDVYLTSGNAELHVPPSEVAPIRRFGRWAMLDFLDALDGI